METSLFKVSQKARPAERGQALIELAAVLMMLSVLVFGLIDFGRFIYERQILVNVTREGANLISRGTTMTNALTAVINSAAPLVLSGTKGRVIMTAVTNSNNIYRITAQVAQGGLSAASKIGTLNGTATFPITTAVPVPQPQQTLYVAEVYYSFVPITPVGKLLKLTMPTRIYDVAFF
jgi:Flp pilus assembly protein TadG